MAKPEISWQKLFDCSTSDYSHVFKFNRDFLSTRKQAFILASTDI